MGLEKGVFDGERVKPKGIPQKGFHNLTRVALDVDPETTAPSLEDSLEVLLVDLNGGLQV